MHRMVHGGEGGASYVLGTPEVKTSYVVWTSEVKTSYTLRASEGKTRFLSVPIPEPAFKYFSRSRAVESSRTRPA